MNWQLLSWSRNWCVLPQQGKHFDKAECCDTIRIVCSAQQHASQKVLHEISSVWVTLLCAYLTSGKQHQGSTQFKFRALTDERTQHVVAKGNFRPDWEVRCVGNIALINKNQCVGVCVCAAICTCDLMQSLIFSGMTANLHPTHPPHTHAHKPPCYL